MPYIYNDEDNVPMCEEMFDRIDQGGHNPTVYTSYSEMRAAEKEPELPFSDPPEDGCWNCRNYNGDFCTIYWNNLDECYQNTERDLREPTDYCDQFERDESVKPEEFFDGTDT